MESCGYGASRKFYSEWTGRIGQLENRIAEYDRRFADSLEEDYRDRNAESRYAERQDTAQKLVDAIGIAWHGWEFWMVCTEYKLNPATMSATWDRNEVLEAYYYIRLRYLREAPGGA